MLCVNYQKISVRPPSLLFPGVYGMHVMFMGLKRTRLETLPYL